MSAEAWSRSIRLDLEARAPAVRATTERDPAVPPGERLLARQADRILASAGASGGTSVDPRLGEMIAVLTGAGAIAPDSPVPGHLAALCRRLGADPHGITAPAAADIPGPWASVLAGLDTAPAGLDTAPAGLDTAPAGLDTAPAGQGPDWFAPLGVILPDVDGARFAVAGLSFAGDESDLHVVAGGSPERAAHGWDPGFSWWVRDDAGTWHVARETGRSEFSPGLAGGSGWEVLAGGSGWEVEWLRLTPPLRRRPHAIEVVVTGPATRVRAVVPVREGSAMADT
jgi:hypothetical protein